MKTRFLLSFLSIVGLLTNRVVCFGRAICIIACMLFCFNVYAAETLSGIGALCKYSDEFTEDKHSNIIDILKSDYDIPECVYNADYIQSEDGNSGIWVENGFTNFQGCITICPPGYIVPFVGEKCLSLQELSSNENPLYNMYADYYVSGWHIVPYGYTSFDVLSFESNEQKMPILFDESGDIFFVSCEMAIAEGNNCEIIDNIKCPIIGKCPGETKFPQGVPHINVEDCTEANEKNYIITHITDNIGSSGISCSINNEEAKYHCYDKSGWVYDIDENIDDVLLQLSSDPTILDPSNDGVYTKCAIYSTWLEEEINPSNTNKILCIPGTEMSICESLKSAYPDNKIDIFSVASNNIDNIPQSDYTVIFNPVLTEQYCGDTSTPITITYTITYNLGGGIGCSDETYTLGMAKTLSCVPTRSGYTFNGWYDSATGGNKITQITALDTGDKTFYAQWSPIEYTITYELNGGIFPFGTQPINSYTFGVGATIDVTPTKLNSIYNFIGWCTDSELTSCAKTQTISTSDYGNKTFYAKWGTEIEPPVVCIARECLVGYEWSDEECACVKSGLPTLGCSAGEYLNDGECTKCPAGTYSLFNASECTPCDVNTYAAGEGNFRCQPCPDGTTSPAGATSEEQCVPDANTYTITYELNGGINNSANPTSYTIESATITLSDPTKDGYTFNGWYTTPDFSDSAVTSILRGSTGNKTFYAKWTANTITCPAGTYLPANTTQCTECPENSYCAGGTNSYSETDPQGIEQCPTGYSLSEGGATSEAECYRQCSASDVPHLKSGGTITGMYYSNNTNACEPANDASCADGYHYVEGNPLANIDTSIDGIGHGFKSSDDDFYSNTDKYGLTEINTWATEFSYGVVRGKALCSASSSGTQGEIGTPNESGSGQYCWCQIDGYTPTGGSKQSLSGAWVFNADNVFAGVCANYCARNCADNLQRNAGFRAALLGSVGASPAICEANTYTITYNLDGGTNNSANPTSYTIESATITLSDPTKDGYTFNGWIDGNGNPITDIPTGSTGNITLTAQWTPAVIHCDAGYYLPANSTTCQPCKTKGTYCDAGDYTISNQNQGILNCPIPDNITGAFIIDYNESNDFNDNGVYDSAEECTALFMQTQYGNNMGQDAIDGYDPDNEFNQNIALQYSDCKYNLDTNSYKCIIPTSYEVICTGGYYIPETTVVSGASICDWSNGVNKECYNIDLANMTNPCIPAQPGYYTTWYDRYYDKYIKNDPEVEEVFNRMHGFGGMVAFNMYANMFGDDSGNTLETLSDQYAKCPQEYPNSDAGAWTINMCYRTCPSKDGYTLVSEDREYYNETNKCEYTANTYTITYELNGGSGCANETYTLGTAKELSCVPTRTGYTFDGWYDAATGGNKITQITALDIGDKTFYAQWSIAVVHCDAGYYLPSNNIECQLCSENHYCDGGDYIISTEYDAGIELCPDGTTSPEGASGADGCGKILHVGDNIIYLTTVQETTPALAVRLEDKVYYARTTPVSEGAKPMNKDTTESLRVRIDGIEYSIHDNTIKGEQ